MADFTIGRGARLPALEMTVMEGAKPHDLTPYSEVRLVGAQVDGSEQFNGVCTVDADPTTGKITYPWGPLDTQTAGVYRAEVICIVTAGNELHLPTHRTMTIEVVEPPVDV
ncbi:MAG: hypothetical protein ACF8PN_08125 [Phycisphaerales bacterium]